jgi:CubicO group peptidase (beta-lactamase class C family)
VSLQTILDEAVAAGAAPGVSAAVLQPDGSVSLAASGRVGAVEEAAVSADTLFWIASCTKAVTSVAALKLVEAGVLDLDAPVGERAPGLASPQVLEGFDADGTPRLRPAREPITLRRLLAHTSGLAYDFFSAELGRCLAAQGVTMAGGGGEPGHLPLLFEPGGGWQYGIGIDWVGRLIETASGEPLDEHFERAIFAPLGMRETRFFPDPEAPRCRQARKAGPGEFAPIESPPASARSFWMGGGGLYSTPRDYLKFLSVIAGGGAPLLGATMFQEMMRSQTGEREAGGLKAANPALSNDFAPLAGRRPRHGLAGLVNLDGVPGGRSAGSLAWAGLANCYYWADPARGAAGVLMAQVFPFADPQILAAFDAVEQWAYR